MMKKNAQIIYLHKTSSYETIKLKKKIMHFNLFLFCFCISYARHMIIMFSVLSLLCFVQFMEIQ